MSRLIDADKFKEYIVDGFEQNKDLFTDEQRDFVKVVTCGFLKDIDEQPTAYNIDEIVEQLRSYLNGWVPVETIYEVIKIVEGGAE